MSTTGTDKTETPPAVVGPFAGPDAFLTTHWSVVLAAGQPDTTKAYDALTRLCQTYWHPLYAYVRRLGYSPHDAQDLTQEFFARLLARNSLAGADESRGRFRSYLLASLKHFLANEWDKARAQKRGGGQVPIPIDPAAAATGCVFEPADPVTAEKIYERRWAPTLTEARRSVRYAEIAIRLGSSEGAVKVAVHRLRQRYREVLRAEIADTVAGPGEVEDELRNLFAALAG